VAIYFGRALTVLNGRAMPTMAQMIRDLPPPLKTGTSTPTHAPAVAAAAANFSRPARLAAAAELCVDLSRVTDAADVPALLERTATVLDARGIVVWAVDSDGALLRPALSQGYADKILAKLRPLQIDADNVTSLAFRSLQPQTVNGASNGDSAAIAIPLMAAGGCVGVMAAELRHSRPHADLLPVARILGAQFSTLIAPMDQGQRAEGRRAL
jgi:GAF domain-containing protein